VPYNKTTWIDGVTEFIASIMNKIEVGIETAQATAESKADSSHSHTKAEAGLGNVDNTADLSKPVSTAMQTALNSKANTHSHPYRANNWVPTAGDVGALASGAKAVDSDKLDGIVGEHYRGLNYGSTTQDPNVTAYPNILTKHANGPDSSYYYHITTTFYSTVSSGANRSQVANGYNTDKMHYRKCYSGVWTPWKRLHDSNNLKFSLSGDTLTITTT